MPIPEQGEEIRTFLIDQGFEEDLSQTDHYQLGFQSLRRNDLVKLAGRIGETWDVIPPKEKILPLMDAWLAEGRFDELIKKSQAAMTAPEVHLLQSQIETLQAGHADEIATLTEQIANLTNLVMENRPQNTASSTVPKAADSEAADASGPSPRSAEIDTSEEDAGEASLEMSYDDKVAAVQDMKYRDMQTYAKSLGMEHTDYFGKSTDVLRGMIVHHLERFHKGADAEIAA